MRATLSGWGRYPRVDCRVLEAAIEDDAVAAVMANSSLIARGNGRAYGDAALNPHATLSLRTMQRLLAFDPGTGLLTCEAGTLLADILDVFVPRGWFPAVTPGTRLVSVGGMIAADVHGKNHHVAGSFGDHVVSLDLLGGDGRVVTCGPTREPELFAATRGGMGLTGIILRATFRLIPIETAHMRQETLRAANLDQIMRMFEESAAWTYTVAWIDCLARGAGLGRGVMMRGEHARRDDVPPPIRLAPLHTSRRRMVTVPCDAPAFVLHRSSVAAFNALYWHCAKPGSRLTSYDSFFYPLDGVHDWNRLYGRRGFLQYQCVLPKSISAEGLRALLERVSAKGNASFLAVLKRLGPQHGILSFPMEGYTLALDFPAASASFALLLDLDAIVDEFGGRVYLAKDARMPAQTMSRGYPAWDYFRSYRARHGLSGLFRSVQSERLGL